MRHQGSVYKNRAEQVSHYLRECLSAGHWAHWLPPERDLAEQLGVSRWSLRAALKELQREGFIGERSQAGTRIIPQTGAPRPAHQLSVGLVIASRANLANGRILLMIDSMRHYLQTQGAALEIYKTPYLASGGVSAHFKRLLSTEQHDCWALVAPPEAMQQWCAQHHIPTMIVGSGAESAGLPNSSVDLRATCRHAAGLLIAKGHREIAMLLSTPEKSEDALSRMGFEEGIRDSPQRDVRVRYEVQNSSFESVRLLADRLLAARRRPTVWFICRQGYFTRLFTHLLHRGIRIPEELSIVCRDSDEYFGDFTPRPTHYHIDRSHLNARWARLALRVAMGQALPGETVRVMPEFVPGETLGPPAVEAMN